MRDDSLRGKLEEKTNARRHYGHFVFAFCDCFYTFSSKQNVEI